MEYLTNCLRIPAKQTYQRRAQPSCTVAAWSQPRCTLSAGYSESPILEVTPSQNSHSLVGIPRARQPSLVSILAVARPGFLVGMLGAEEAKLTDGGGATRIASKYRIGFRLFGLRGSGELPDSRRKAFLFTIVYSLIIIAPSWVLCVLGSP